MPVPVPVHVTATIDVNEYVTRRTELAFQIFPFGLLKSDIVVVVCYFRSFRHSILFVVIHCACLLNSRLVCAFAFDLVSESICVFYTGICQFVSH